MQSTDILNLLQSPNRDGAAAKRAIRENAPVDEIIVALQSAIDTLTRQILCDILGERHERKAVVPLILCLNDVSPNVRSAAADALAKIGDGAAGSALLEHYVKETDAGTRHMLAAALGAVQHREAIPPLIDALDSDDASLRGTAAWSLGHLGATEAYLALVAALKRETLAYARERMTEAIRQLERLIRG